MVYEVEGTPATRLLFTINGKTHSFSLAEARAFPALFVEYEVAEAFLDEHYGITREFLNKNRYDEATIWHNCYKTQFWPAVHESEYRASAVFEETPPRRGESWYYARVVQYNGQIAWSSPIWLTPES
jgi:hypothetical protein